MRVFLCAAAVIGAALSSSAFAAELPVEAPEGKRWMSCFIRLMDTDRGYNRPIAVGGYWLIDVPADARKATEDRLRVQWLQEYLNRIPSEFPGFVAVMNKGEVDDARCTSYSSRQEWANFVRHVKEPVTSTSVLRSDFVPSFAQGWVSTREHARGYTGEVGTSGGATAKVRSETVEDRSEPTELQVKSDEDSAKDTEEARNKAREQREAEFQAKVAAHEAEVADYRRKVAEREAEIARQQRQQAAAEDAAAREKAAYEAKMAAHRRELDAANQRQQEYFAAQRRHALCLNGDKAACDAIAVGNPPTGEQLAEKEEASTDTDATRCVSPPVLSGNATFEGNTAATVVNGCDTAVDVKICLMREGGWNCGMVSGLQPQDRWSHSSFKSSGEIFWDARVAGSSKPLASPGGN